MQCRMQRWILFTDAMPDAKVNSIYGCKGEFYLRMQRWILFTDASQSSLIGIKQSVIQSKSSLKSVIRMQWMDAMQCDLINNWAVAIDRWAQVFILFSKSKCDLNSEWPDKANVTSIVNDQMWGGNKWARAMSSCKIRLLISSSYIAAFHNRMSWA